jgi:hypothetical protein
MYGTVTELVRLCSILPYNFAKVFFFQIRFLPDKSIAHVDALDIVSLTHHNVSLQLSVDVLQSVVRD